MNWYRRLIKLCQGVLEKPQYTDIGHSGIGNVPLTGGSNYMWIFDGRSISKKLETRDEDSHSYAFPNVTSWDRIYYGRYDSLTGELSLKIPIAGMAAHRDVPMSLINGLYTQFPNITEILTF